MAPDIGGHDNRFYHTGNRRSGYIQFDGIEIFRSSYQITSINTGVDWSFTTGF